MKKNFLELWKDILRLYHTNHTTRKHYTGMITLDQIKDELDINHESLIGYIDIRIGNTPGLLYGGHIGYTILEDFRGHKYAQRASELIFNVGLQHGLNKLFITCAPNNIPSRKTLENLGLKLIGILDLPKHNEMYIEGKRIVSVFEYINI